MQIHYAVFGEQNSGHALLAASGNSTFAAKLTVLTDRPGHPPVGVDWGPVISGFALEDQFVFMRMQPDPTVRRAGMVRTYAAYTPLATLGSLNNISLLFSILPSGLDAIPSSIVALDVPDAPLAARPDPTLAKARFALARLLCAPDTKLPLLWNSAESYLPTVATLWAQLPPGLREGFSFYFLFAPEHHTATTPTLIATLPDLTSRWPSAPVVSTAEGALPALTPAQSWLAGSGDGNQFDEVLRDYEIDLPQFSRLNLISSFADMIGRIPTLSFVEARKAVNIAAKYSRFTAASKPHRGKLFARLCALAQAGNSAELLTLRNLEDSALPDLIPELQAAMLASMTTHSASTALDKTDFDLLEMAVAAPTNWWSKPFISWLRQSGKTMDAAGVERLITLSTSAKLLAIVADKLPASGQTETEILTRLPQRLATASAENLIALAAKRGWMRLHAGCLGRSLGPEEAITRHADIAGLDASGLQLLEQLLGFKTLVQVACTTGHPALIAFTGGSIGTDSATYLSMLPQDCQHKRIILQHAVSAASGPLLGELRLLILEMLDATEPADASLGDLSAACAARDVSLLTELSDPAVFISRLPEGERGRAERDYEAWLQNELTVGRPLRIKNVDSFSHWLGDRSVLDWLSKVPPAISVQIGVETFRHLHFLTDEDCRDWLIALFTRTQSQRLSSTAATALSDFLNTVDFPESAKIVRDTAVDYNRTDVFPVHEQIRSKYQASRTYPHKPGASSPRLHKVLIVTALPLERLAVIANLPTTAYDHALQADVAVWPAENPYYEVYVVTSGAGNLTAQGSCHQFLKSGVKPRLALFVGVCGGVKDNSIGDVVFSTKVYYTEGGKEENEGVKARPLLKETSTALVQLGIRVSEMAWQPSDSARIPRPPSASPAVFASSELVLTSTEPTAKNFQQIKTSYNDTQVVDMEAYGFLKAMQDDGIKLSMVIRGVSDTIAKKAESDAQGNQPLAVKNAAAFLFTLLRECRPLLEPKAPKKKGLINFFFGS